jgi:hypothetical protein
MSIREALNNRPKTASAIAGTVLVVSIIYAANRQGSATLQMDNQLYFSADDGKTFFVDDASNIPPFDYNGKQAVQAVVFRCGNGQPFVGYLLRYPSGAKSALEAFPTGQRMSSQDALAIRKGAAEVKKPGAKKWVSLGTQDPNAHLGDILHVDGPPGSDGDPQEVDP